MAAEDVVGKQKLARKQKTEDLKMSLDEKGEGKELGHGYEERPPWM